ncbi:MAG: alpha-L-rhamnosidase family protein [Verrucomicrobia bacterium]|nr:alpha-L-rhamnosidase family protein [Verrucomicrobiota bacterium]
MRLPSCSVRDLLFPVMKTKKKPAPKKIVRATPANAPVELTFTAEGLYVDPFNQVVLDAVFTDPAGGIFRVPAFWAGSNRWKVRYASSLTGSHAYRTECSIPADGGLHALTGKIEIAPYRGKNPLYAHGPVQVASDRRHFEHADGTPFFWLGDTWWMGLCHRLSWPRGFRQLTANRTRKGFNVVQIIAGLYPDMHPFDPRGANEAGFPWEEGYAHIRPEYFDAADKRLAHLVAEGITPCIVGAWGYFIAWMTEDQLKAHWRYLIARYAAWPVLWCTAGEANLPWYLAKNFPEDDRLMVKGWTRLIRYVRETDPFHRPVTIHPTAIRRYTARNATEDESLLDFDMLQVSHAQNEAVGLAIQAVRETYAATPRMPVINGEPCYEMLMGTITAPWPRRAFWSCVLNGAMGHTYGGNGIWQCNQPGIPHGASPHGGNYGNTPWQVAMNYTGSAECGHGKRLLTRFAWEKFAPHPEWAAYAGNVWVSLEGAKWIWSSNENPPKDSPSIRRYFRKTFDLAPGRKLASARLRFSATGHGEAQLNGAPAGTGWEWRAGSQFNDRAPLLKTGRNVLTLWCEHRPPSGDVPGLLACLELKYADGRVERILTDETWKAWTSKIGGWDARGYDDKAWPGVVVLGRLGDPPWGPIGVPDLSLHGPQSAGIPDKVRVTYVPYSEPVTFRDLGPRTSHRATHFDPVTGKSKSLGTVTAGKEGAWTCPPPKGIDHDWVMVLESVS